MLCQILVSAWKDAETILEISIEFGVLILWGQLQLMWIRGNIWSCILCILIKFSIISISNPNAEIAKRTSRVFSISFISIP